MYAKSPNAKQFHASNDRGLSASKSTAVNISSPGSESNKKTYGLILRENVPDKLKVALNKMNAAPITGIVNLPPVPPSFDCREKWPALITGPLDQRSCGSCWAFAIATASSDRYRIAFPNDPDLNRKTQYRDGNVIFEELNNFNPWHLASCNLCKTNPLGEVLEKAGVCNTEACAGQVLQIGMQYLSNTGVILTDCDPHQKPCIQDAKNCIYDCEDPKGCKFYKPKFFHQLNDDLADQLGTERGKFNQYALMNDGPLVIGIKIYKSFETFYESAENATKVYSAKVKSELADNGGDTLIGGHAVVIVGWGTDSDGTDFWLVRNSWGRNWADHGYFRIERGINFLGCGDDVWASHWGNTCKTCIDVLLPGEKED